MSESLLLLSKLTLLLLLLWSELALLLRPESTIWPLESLVIVHKKIAWPLTLWSPWPLRSVAKVLSTKKCWDLILLSESKTVGVEVVLSLVLPFKVRMLTRSPLLISYLTLPCL